MFHNWKVHFKEAQGSGDVDQVRWKAASVSVLDRERQGWILVVVSLIRAITVSMEVRKGKGKRVLIGDEDSGRVTHA